MTSGAQTRGGQFIDVCWGSMAFFLPPECSFWLPYVLGAGVDNARDNSWRGRFMVWLYMWLSLPTWRVDVDGLA
jgi:hypothetical protein